MRPSALLPLASLVFLLSASDATQNPNLGAMVVKESLRAVPHGFAHAGPVSADEEITLRIALAHTDMAGLQAKTYAVSDPANALYGQHLTADEVATYIQPTPQTLALVTSWLASHNITPTSISSSILSITLPVHQANTLLKTQFASFKHSESGWEGVRTLAYSLPAGLQAHVDYVHPTVAFVPPLRQRVGVTAVKARKRESDVYVDERAGRAADAVPMSCASVVNPSCLQAIYGIPTDAANNSDSNVLGVAGFIEQYANEADIALFLRSFRPDVAPDFSLVTLDGGQNDQTLANSGIEAVLDMQMVKSLATEVPATFFSVGPNTTDMIGGFVDLPTYIMGMPVEQRPTVMSVSYGFNEPQIPQSLAVAMCNAYTQLGAVGVSVLFASGDGGVGGVQPTNCTTFVPTAPGGCPFITSVGGSAGLPPQFAASLSGGGFSNYFTTPDYQQSDVTKYLATLGNTYAGLYNQSGRGMPDVAAQAENVEIAWMNEFWLVAGTSCASPIFASMIALVNDRLIAAGKPVLGFLNPFLYSTGRTAFTDVTQGTNPGCNTNGFSASTGWDPITGLGTPNFTALLTAVGL
ncbi:subtilisin-like protein [Mycena filopes]|nr:subtilisin-like protein [Mycena filopes]